MPTLRDVLTIHLEYLDMRDVIFASKVDGKFTLDSFAATMPKHWHNEDSDSVEFCGVENASASIDDYLFGSDDTDDTEYLETPYSDRLDAAQDLIDFVNYNNELLKSIKEE